MMKRNQEDSVTFWQDKLDDDTLVGEPAIVLTTYSDVLEFQQEGRYINVTLSCVPELIKAIKAAVAEK